LILVLCNSAAYGSKRDMTVAAGAKLSILHTRDSLLPGTSIGTDQFVNEFLVRRGQEVHDKYNAWLLCQDN
jgi:hypothetical protein